MRAKVAIAACHSTDVKKNPGVALGLILGVAANAGRDKLTFFTSPSIYDMGAWFEQLIAESTGKQGKGITPVNLEELGDPDVYGNDRVFAYLRLEGADNAHLDAAVEKLETAGQPVVVWRCAISTMPAHNFLPGKLRRPLPDLSSASSLQSARRGSCQNRSATPDR